MPGEEAQVITINGEQITEDEIAGFHVDPVSHGFWIILSYYQYKNNNHRAEDYHVNPGDPDYEQVKALYDSMFRVTVDEEEKDVVYFRARNYQALRDIYDYLESNRYGFTFLLGATRHNYICIRRSSRKYWLRELINDYKPEPEED